MKVFLQDYYLRSLGWYAFKEAIVDGSLNLSLYFDKYINESALLNSSNKAKVFSVSLLKNYSRIEAEISKLIDSLNKLIGIVEINGQDNEKVEKVEVLENLKNILNLVEDGNVFSIDSKKIDQAKKLFNKNNKKQLKEVNAIVKSIKENLDKIEKYNVFDIFISKKIFDEYIQFFEKLLDGLYNNLEIKTFKLKTRSRLIVGLGDESVYETSIRLHRNYGVPYIPGSALKGVAKHYTIYKLVEDNYSRLESKFSENDFFELAGKIQKLLEEPNDDKTKEFENFSFGVNGKSVTFGDARKIFGTQKQEGSVIFFDAFPDPASIKGKPVLELDIMNPHHQPYYQGNEPPGDWHSPNPIFFLTVPDGTEFQFAIAPHNDETDLSLLDKAAAILKEALKEHGVGAKTSLGYGRLV